MPSIDQVVRVQISRQTQVPSRPGFGTPLFVGEDADWTERVRLYTGIDSVANDLSLNTPEYNMAAAAFSQNPRPVQIKIGRKNIGEAWNTALAAIVAEDDDWYGLAISSRVADDIYTCAQFIEPRIKLFIPASADAGILSAASSSDIAARLHTAAFARTGLMFHNQAESIYPDAAWLGRMLPTNPGSATWKFKTLNGITVDKLDPTSSQNVLNKKANTYETVGGQPMTGDGTTAEPEFIDIMHGVDWLTAQIQYAVFGHLKNVDKIPFTNPGIAVVRHLLATQLDLAIDRQVLAPEPRYTITVPDVLATDPIDRGNRLLRDVNFSARLAGAIHNVWINGVVTV